MAFPSYRSIRKFRERAEGPVKRTKMQDGFINQTQKKALKRYEADVEVIFENRQQYTTFRDWFNSGQGAIDFNFPHYPTDTIKPMKIVGNNFDSEHLGLGIYVVSFTVEYYE